MPSFATIVAWLAAALIVVVVVLVALATYSACVQLSMHAVEWLTVQWPKCWPTAPC
jgi:hypothetical protein